MFSFVIIGISSVCWQLKKAVSPCSEMSVWKDLNHINFKGWLLEEKIASFKKSNVNQIK